MLDKLRESSSGINSQRCTADDKQIALLKSLDRRINRFMVKVLLIKRNARAYDTAASVTMRNSLMIQNVIKSELLTAVHAVISEYGTVKFNGTLGPCILVKLINILRNDSKKLALSLKSYESLMRLIRLSIRIQKLPSVEVVKLLRVLDKERM